MKIIDHTDDRITLDESDSETVRIDGTLFHVLDMSMVPNFVPSTGTELLLRYHDGVVLEFKDDTKCMPMDVELRIIGSK